MLSVRWGRSSRGRTRRRPEEKSHGPPHHPLLQCLYALPGRLVVEPGVPLLLAPGPPPGLVRGHVAGEAAALPGSLLLPDPVCPDHHTPVPAPPPHLSAFRPAGFPHLGAPAGRPPALSLHLQQVSDDVSEFPGPWIFYQPWNFGSFYSLSNVCVLENIHCWFKLCVKQCCSLGRTLISMVSAMAAANNCFTFDKLKSLLN